MIHDKLYAGIVHMTPRRNDFALESPLTFIFIFK